MSNNKSDITLLLPGESGWDLWNCSGSKVSLLEETSLSSALEISQINSSKPLRMAFPVKEVTALSIIIPAEEADEADDLVSLHVEKVGLAQGEEMGTLHQYSISDLSSGQKFCAIDVLRPPVEGSLPKVSPESFAISPHCFPMEANAITLWQEFGKWVLTITDQNAKPIHYQGFTGAKLTTQIHQDIQFIIAQLMLQGILTSQPQRCIIWSANQDIQPEGFEQLAEAVAPNFSAYGLELLTKPAPILPPAGTLLPADTRAERVQARLQRQRNIIFSVVGVLLVALLGFACFKLISLQKRAQLAEREAIEKTASIQSIVEHSDKWQELAVVVDSQNDPFLLLLECTRAIPSTSLRFNRTEITHQPVDEDFSTDLSIVIEGVTENFALATQFDENLQKRPQLSHLKWTNQSPVKTATGWKFTYRAERK